MKKLGNFIVKGRYWFLGIFFLLLVGSAVLMNFVTVNYDLTEYLPENSTTKQSIQQMKEEFGATGTAGMMITNISEERAGTLADNLKNELPEIQTCVVSKFQSKDGTGYAMLTIFLESGDYTKEAEQALGKIETFMKDNLNPDQNYYMVGSAVTAMNSRSAIQKEIPIILIVAVLVVLLVLSFTTRSWFEPLIILIVIGSAILINMGTNYFLGSISFISNSISSILLIALAMDYSIVLVNRFREERDKNPGDVYEAMKSAINGSFVTIVASGCTVMAGLLSLVFMTYKIGFDMGIVLTKGVFISLLAVIFLMPAVLLLLTKIIQKTTHKNFLSKVGSIGTFAKKTRFIIPIVFLLLVGGAFYVQHSMLNFDYAAKFNKSGSQVYENEQKVKEVFGNQNSLVVLLQAKDGETILLSDQAQIDLATQIKNIQINPDAEENIINSTSTYLTSGADLKLKELNPYWEESLHIELGYVINLNYMCTHFPLATLMGYPNIDQYIYTNIIETVGNATAFAQEGQSVTVYNIIRYSAVPENQAIMLTKINEWLLTLMPGADDPTSDYHQAYLQLKSGYSQMVLFAASKGEKEAMGREVYYSADQSFVRMIFNINAPQASDEAKAVIAKLHTILDTLKQTTNSNSFIINNTQNNIETGDVFVGDRLKVELISAIAILIICLFSFRSISLPILLVLIIEGSIWINLASNALMGNSIFFICYLLGTAIQMGATIDYGILLVDRYKEARRTQDKFTAIKTAIDKSFATIVSSGTILTLAAFAIGLLSSVPLISSIGYLIGFGALIASISILFVLPQTLLLCDKLIAKTTLKSNFVAQTIAQPEAAQQLTQNAQPILLEPAKTENVLENSTQTQNSKQTEEAETENENTEKEQTENKQTQTKNETNLENAQANNQKTANEQAKELNKKSTKNTNQTKTKATKKTNSSKSKNTKKNNKKSKK